MSKKKAAKTPERGGTRAGAGRKAKAGGRKVRSQLAMFPAVWERLAQVAGKRGVSMGDYVMHAIMTPKEIEHLEDASSNRTLNRGGNARET